MAYPLEPVNDEIYIKDGVRYIYASATNSWTIQSDPNKVASNIKSGVTIDGVEGSLTGGLSNIYITPAEMPIGSLFSETPTVSGATSINISGVIYLPFVIKKPDSYGNFDSIVAMMRVSLSGAFEPTIAYAENQWASGTTNSIYLYNGKIYVNIYVGSTSTYIHYYWDLATQTWSAYQSNTVTTGTYISGFATENGLIYQQHLLCGTDPNSDYLIIPVCKVTAS